MYPGHIELMSIVTTSRAAFSVGPYYPPYLHPNSSVDNAKFENGRTGMTKTT